MKWAEVIETIAAKLREDWVSTGDLERLAREIPLRAQDEHHANVGCAIERVLGERYRGTFSLMYDAEVFAAGHGFPGDEYRDRVDRARSDACYRVLESRKPGEPFDTFPYADDVQNAPSGAWRAHVASFYGITA